jgi:hypothetical protein
MLSDLWQFVVAVFWRWQSWAGGSGVGGAIVVFFAIYQQLSGNAVPKRLYVAVFIVGFLFCAFFLAWRDQRDAAATMQKKLDESTKPKLVGEIDQAGVVGQAVDEHGKLFIDVTDTGIFVFATIKNIGAPSVVVIWNLAVHIPGKGPMKAAKRLLPATMRLDRQSMMYAEDALYNKAVNSPVPTGGQISGVLLFVLEGVARDDVWKQGTVLTLEFQDVLGTKSEASVTLTGANEPFKYLPGMRQPLPMVQPPGKQH